MKNEYDAKPVDQLGYDLIAGAGVGIHGQVMGPKAGAAAFRQSIDAVVEGVDIRDAAKKHRELDVSLKTWGIYGVDDYSKLYEIEA
jgi:2,3-diketo-5-methylthiopentyl-1-phosphate enolase